MRKEVLILFLVVFFSCTNNKRVPGNILQQDKMKEIMWDMMKADEFVKLYIERDSTRDKKLETEKLYNQVFGEHAVTKQQFQKSLHFYESRPDLLLSVMDSINKMANRSEEDMYKPKTVNDSATVIDKKRILKSQPAQ